MSASSAPPVSFTRLLPQSDLRAAITAAYRRPEPECLPSLLALARLPPASRDQARALAGHLAGRLRAKGQGSGVEGLIHEYSLSSHEGVALMCLAEALLRIPDDETRDALIRDKIGGGDWQAHLGHSPSLFVNAATWGLLLTGKLTATHSEGGLSAALARLVARGGEPLIRHGVNLAMRLMGEQFVSGQSIEEALANGEAMEAKGFRYSFDMLGEAAVTAAQAEKYFADYRHAIDAIGKASAGRGVQNGPGISVKLSALHPRYSRSQIERVQAELYPRLKALAIQARSYDIGLNIDAEEADRLDISLDLLERLCFEPELADWHGIGFVVQAYQKRCVHVIDWLIDLARRSGYRLMVRLVKGAYWDGEIKRAQVDGLAGFPVFTRKIHTDVSFIACAAKLLAATEHVYPQFATHNAMTLATIHAMSPGYLPGQYEFQCLHGMGEGLYEEVVGADKLDRPCRIYAPVGTHETLLAYLVRRLLENGANTSFVHQIADLDFPLDRLLADPVEIASGLLPVGAPHPRIALPRDLFAPVRANSKGADLSDEHALAAIDKALQHDRSVAWRARPLLGDGRRSDGTAREVRNPADSRDVVGTVVEAEPDLVDAAIAHGRTWNAPPEQRAAVLLRAADRLEERTPQLVGLVVREAGKTMANAYGELREAVDFLRYYASQLAGWSNDTHKPLGVVACISPWNFPASIFAGQVAASLAAGNGVIAKPAEETPLIADQVVQELVAAGLPHGVLRLLPGDGKLGARLVAHRSIAGVVFTGSTEAARSIQKTLAQRLGRDGKPVPLIAETGGQNALVADSTALPEQLVNDVLASAFDSAGQRCSALRVLCVQEDIADHFVPMLKQAMAELAVGNPARLAVDIGPVISDEARRRLEQHVERMRATGHTVHRLALPDETRHGFFVAPAVIEVSSVTELKHEVFGPVLHVFRYAREHLDEVIRQVNATGYALTFGVHSRIDETIERATAASAAGNQYVNRTIVGALVGVQPFGGHGLSGTGPKAGGPLYLLRLLAERPEGALPAEHELPGPVGERNSYGVRPRGAVLCLADDPAEHARQQAVVRASGNRLARDESDADLGGVLFAGSREGLLAAQARLAAREGPVVPIFVAPYPVEFLVGEVSLSVNTAAAGGNASLMTIG